MAEIWTLLRARHTRLFREFEYNCKQSELQFMEKVFAHLVKINGVGANLDSLFSAVWKQSRRRDYPTKPELNDYKKQLSKLEKILTDLCEMENLHFIFNPYQFLGQVRQPLKAFQKSSDALVSQGPLKSQSIEYNEKIILGECENSLKKPIILNRGEVPKTYHRIFGTERNQRRIEITAYRLMCLLLNATNLSHNKILKVQQLKNKGLKIKRS